ncbi:MAG: DUF4091 domain-containing protein [Clostridiaceae bacterium]|nr:DUF4091 domain-containing protein [Clostridiaceae bacterium]
MSILDTRVISSLEKVFPDCELQAAEWKKGSMLSNEVYTFQIAYKWNSLLKKGVKLHVVSTIASSVTMYSVGLMPVEMPAYGDHDDNVLRGKPGMYPDILYPICPDGLVLLPHQWRSLWITVNPKGKVPPGEYTIEVLFETKEGDLLARESFEIEIIGMELPKQKLIFTQWFHSDCIATWYKTEVFSEEHWKLLERYVKTAAAHGINMILTPVFTPPLDTAVGGERPTVQLVDVKKTQDTYSFNFDKLTRWVNMCKANGIEYFEISHLFTQWGAKHAPKIMADVDGEYKRIFGWETDAAGEDYKHFLDCFLPALVSYIKENGLADRCFFHISYEPGKDHLESYAKAGSIIMEHVKDFPVIDALSDYEFYKNGLVKNPIPANNHIEPFLENNVPNLWTYYCCGQYKKVSNRFIDMPSARNRIIGLQLYKFNIVGFLQWGHNFWYSHQSRYPIDPFRVADGGFWVPAGDAYSVYPGEDGPIESIRLDVFYDALQDLRALNLLEQYIGKEETIKLLEKDMGKPLTFDEYPKDAQWLLNKREEINKKLKEFI